MKSQSNKNLNKTGLAIGMALILSATAQAGHRHDGKNYDDLAPVISATPVYKTIEVITPKRNCWTKKIRRKHHHGRGHGHAKHSYHTSYTAPLVGALVGGAVGNQFGGGSGKTALTVGGALLGASIGNDYANSHKHIGHSHRHGHRHRPVVRTVRRCETVRHKEIREELAGYRVKYRYNDKIHVTRMDHHPGDYVRVNVDVRPL